MDLEAARKLGDALRRAGYTEEAIRDALDDEPYPADQDDTPLLERRLEDTPFATLVRLLYFKLPVPTDELVRVLGAAGVSALEAAGLANVSRESEPRLRILPMRGLLIASDDFGDESDPDYVAAYTPTTRLVDMLTVRRPVARALDMATGSGVHALLAAQHAEHVIATDVNQRALDYTELNAALNGLTNVEVRLGSLFEPVQGERFDLITSNAPYVVSPESRWVYRDAGFNADELSERVVSAAGTHLNDGGFATLLVSWVAGDPDEPDERPLEWVEHSGCDAWILPAWEADPLEHAQSWNTDLEGDDEKLARALDEWTDHFDELGVEWITEGVVILHRRDAAEEYSTRLDEIDADELEEAGEQVERAFASRARLDELAGARLAVAMPLVVEREIEPGRGVVAAKIFLDAGTNSMFEADPDAVEQVAALDGSQTLADGALELAQELLEVGALKFVS